MTIKTFGLVGFPLHHSFSKKYFTEKFQKEKLENHQYKNFEIENINSIQDIIKTEPSLVGFNCTIPYKEKIIPYLTDLDNVSSAIKAVNTVKVINYNGKIILKGYNTDAYGFENSLKPLFKKQPSKALILGTGGASKAVSYVLEKLSIQYLFVSRSKDKPNTIAYDEVTDDLIKSHTLIINTSPVGMFPNINEAPPISYNAIAEEHILYDLIYNPETTMFLNHGLTHGAVIKNGLEMLHLQAEKAWEIWNNDTYN